MTSAQRRADQIRELRGGKSAVDVATEMLEAMAAARKEAATPRPYPADEHVLSCPGCGLWQLHYTDAVAMQWAQVRGGPVVRGGGMAAISLDHFEGMVEELLREHVARECTQPMLFFAIAKDRGVL